MITHCINILDVLCTLTHYINMVDVLCTLTHCINMMDVLCIITHYITMMDALCMIANNCYETTHGRLLSAATTPNSGQQWPIVTQ